MEPSVWLITGAQASGKSTVAGGGFTCIVQDNIYGPDVTAWLDRLACPLKHLMVLVPSVAVVEERHEERRQGSGKVAYRNGYTPSLNDGHVRATPPIGLWLDSSLQTPQETVEEILRRRSEALVD